MPFDFVHYKHEQLATARRPGGVPARNAKGDRLLLYMGIIDILQYYRLFKKFEHAWKSVLHDGVLHTMHLTYAAMGSVDSSGQWTRSARDLCRTPSRYIDLDIMLLASRDTW